MNDEEAKKFLTEGETSCLCYWRKMQDDTIPDIIMSLAMARRQRRALEAAVLDLVDCFKRGGAVLPIDNSEPVTIESTHRHGFSLGLVLVEDVVERHIKPQEKT